MGPLKGVRIVEIASIGPGPFACMMLADAGAEIIRIDRPGGQMGGVPLGPADVMARSRPSVAFDLKHPEAVAAALKLIARADGLVEGFRPGVMERLGLGPKVCLAVNPRLAYGRMTGWGQDGPLAHAAGHDMNYIALSGALDAIGEAGGGPVPPLNLVGDFGGGGMMLAFGLLAAILAARSSGEGQVVDAAMVEGAGALMAGLYGIRAAGLWPGPRGSNILDGGAHFYAPYRCADGKWISLGPIEPQFYRLFRDKLGLADDPEFDRQMDASAWPALKAKVAAKIAGKTRAEWTALFEGTDVCFAPILAMAEAPDHPHARARESFVEVAGVAQPAPAPRFSVSGSKPPEAPRPPGADTRAALADWGFEAAEIDALLAAGAAAQA